MDETAWDAGSRVAELLRFLDGRISDRQLRLFACACYRRAWDRLHVYTRHVVETAERLADGLASAEDLQIAAEAAWTWPGRPAAEAGWVAAALPREAAERSAEWAAAYIGQQEPAHWQQQAAEEERVQCAMLRDVFGNPFRPVRAAASWSTGEVSGLAQVIYARRDFGRMGQLADALVTAGCDCEPMVMHCRQATLHVWGCWVLDLMHDDRGWPNEALRPTGHAQDDATRQAGFSRVSRQLGLVFLVRASC